MVSIKNPFAFSAAYGLQSEFPDKKTAVDYLSRHNFIQDPYIFDVWYNQLSMVDGHISRVRELQDGVFSYLVTYYAAHIERTREQPKRRKDFKHVRELQKRNVNYAE